MQDTLILGAVAYDPKVVTIWDGFREWFASKNLEFDYVLYSNYERQVEGLFTGQCHVAWNSPLAWLQAERIARKSGRRATAVAMRDTDCDLTSVIVVHADSAVRTLTDLRGKTVAVGAADSPQATLIPLLHLAEAGLEPGVDFNVRAFDVLAGKHGDHIGGERDAAVALRRGEVDAACMIDGNHLLFGRDGTLPPRGTRIVTQTAPYDHCNFTVLDTAPRGLVDRFTALLMQMSYDDSEVRALMDLEGLKAWRAGRTEGYALLARAIDRFGTVDAFVAEVSGAPGMTVPELDLATLGLDEGGHLLLKAALARLPVGAQLRVRGTAPGLEVHLRAWCRAQGHSVEWPGGQPEPRPGGARALLSSAAPASAPGPVAVVTRGSAQTGRWHGAERAGIADPNTPNAVWDRPPARWGLAARGAFVEQGGVAFEFALDDKDQVWAGAVQRYYRQAAAAQWDPGTAIEWDAVFDLPAEVETAVVQVMTYLIENETAALIVPARFAAQIHPHFREVMQLLALQAADEARHMEVFTRRALLKRSELGLSTAGGQASLKTLIDEPDFALASFLLSVLGEGSFLVLLWFLRDHAPDPVTRAVARLAAQDEARHVAFGLAHLERQARHDSSLLPRLAQAIQRRHDALRDTAGLNEEVFDALLLLAAGSWEPAAIRAGHNQVMQLVRDMDESRRGHLERLGFEPDQAERLSSLHTRNFM